MLKRYLFALSLLLLVSMTSMAQDITGKWKTIDDDGETVKSIVEIYEKDGKLYGKVLEVYPDPDEPADPLCQNCKGDRKDQKIRGLEIIRDLELSSDGKTYEEGTILDPENGKEYTCKMWLENGELKVRGYVYFVYRTQTWQRVD